MNHPLHTASETPAFKMSGGIYTLTTLELHIADISRVTAQLREMTQKAPHFFDQTAIVLSFAELESVDTVNLQQYRHTLFKHGMVLVAIRGGSQKLQQEAHINGLAWLPAAEKTVNPSHSNVVMINQKSDLYPTISDQAEADKPVNKTCFIDLPVRSGQQVYAKGDLIITGSVSTGAELLAEGNIHVYGTLRGRALAGIKGDTNARIFCRQFEAELISISGQYKIPLSPESGNSLWGACVQIHLDQNSLHIQKL